MTKIIIALIVVILMLSSTTSNHYEYRMIIVNLEIRDQELVVERRKHYNKLANIQIDPILNTLNEEGLKGWELVDVTPVTGCISGYKIGTMEPVTQKLVYHFKRKKS